MTPLNVTLSPFLSPFFRLILPLYKHSIWISPLLCFSLYYFIGTVRKSVFISENVRILFLYLSER